MEEALSHSRPIPSASQEATVLSDEERKQVASLLAEFQHRLLVYIRSLLPNASAAEEVLQEVNLFVWCHAGDYRAGTDFGAWVYRIAHFHVLTYRKKRAREKVQFDDVLLTRLAEQATAAAEQTDRRQEILEECLQQLSEKERTLIHLRYQLGTPVPAIAEQLQRSIPSIYRDLDRIHLALLECVRQRLAAEERT